MHFRGKFSFLSNFHPCKITIGSHTYGNAEAAYQALKCKGYEDKFIDLTGAEAKRLGKYLPMQEDWDDKRIKVTSKKTTIGMIPSGVSAMALVKTI